jgi:hypothetical protein
MEMNALNTTWDLRLTKPYRDGGDAQNQWETAGMKTGATIKGSLNKSSDLDTSWSVEIAIPWKSMKELTKQSLPPLEGDQWRVNFSRVEWEHQLKDGVYSKVPGKKEDNWVWSPQGVVDMHRPERWGYVQFTSKPADQVKVRKDLTGPARDLLHEIYWAQKSYQGKNHRWAKTMKELGLEDSGSHPIAIRTTEKDFEATVIVPIGTNQAQPISIRVDSKITLGALQPAQANKVP